MTKAFGAAARSVHVRRILLGVLVLGLGACSTLLAPGASDPRRSGGSIYSDLLVARMAGGSRDADVAAARYGHALRADPGNVVLLERAFLFSLAAGEMDAALAYATELAARKPQAPLARITLAMRALREGRSDTALVELARAGEASGNGFTTTMLRAWTLAAAGRTDEALRTLDAIPGRDSSEMFVVFHQALIADMGGMPDIARQNYERAMRLTETPNPRVVEAYAAFLARAGDTRAAAEILGPERSAMSENPALAVMRADLAAGRTLSPPIPDARAGAAEAFYGLAGMLAAERGIDLPVIYLRLARDLRPDFDIAAVLLGELFQSQDLWEDAADAYRGVDPASPYFESARIEMARIYDRKDRTEEALAALRAVAQDGPNAFQALVAKGDIYRRRDRWEDAAQAYDRAIAVLGPPTAADWPVFYAHGIALERAKRWPEAEARFRQALDLDPGQPLVLNYLGYSWIDQGVNLNEALEMIRRAVDARPNDGFIVDSLGWAYFRLGQYDKAVEILERAVELEPGDPTLNDHLGDAYWMVGRTREARFQWSHALAFEPEPDQIPLIQDKLDRGLAPAAQAGRDER